MIVIIIILVIIAVIAISKARRKSLIEELKQLILMHDTGRIPYTQVESFCRDHNFSDSEYHEIRKNYYYEAAESDDIHSLRMAAVYASNEDRKAALKYTTRAAELGDVDSMYTLGLRYSSEDEDFSFGYDPQKSLYWYQRAAEKGHGKAMAEIASCYRDGVGVPQDDEKAFAYAKDCAERGYSECAFFLADYYSFPFPDKPYIPKAQVISLMERTMQRGDRETFAKAASKLGYVYGSAYLFDGETDEFSDRRKAAYCFTLAYVLDSDLYDKDNIFKTGYNPSQFELNKWQEDARNLRYLPM